MRHPPEVEEYRIGRERDTTFFVCTNEVIISFYTHGIARIKKTLTAITYRAYPHAIVAIDAVGKILIEIVYSCDPRFQF